VIERIITMSYHDDVDKELFKEVVMITIMFIPVVAFWIFLWPIEVVILVCIVWYILSKMLP
jgi:hypothetical protein